MGLLQVVRGQTVNAGFVQQIIDTLIRPTRGARAAHRSAPLLNTNIRRSVAPLQHLWSSRLRPCDNCSLERGWWSCVCQACLARLQQRCGSVGGACTAGRTDQCVDDLLHETGVDGLSSDDLQQAHCQHHVGDQRPVTVAGYFTAGRRGLSLES
jgi:hypothetical protein